MKLIKLTTGDNENIPVWINPMTVQVVDSKIGAKYKSIVTASGKAYLLHDEAEHVAKLVNEELATLTSILK